MRKSKLAPAKAWRERPIDKWNVLSFTEYLRDKHVDLFGIDYVPFRSWQAEQAFIGGIIGTATKDNPKPRKASNEALKRFIDETFERHVPSREYPGTSFGYVWTYKKWEWQRIHAQDLADKKAEVTKDKAIASSDDVSELSDWLGG